MQSISNHTSPWPQPSVPSALPTPQPLPSQKHEPSTPPETAGSPRAQGDRELAMAYSETLLMGANRDDNIPFSAIPPDSTFGQWWGQLRDAFQSPEVLQWVRDKGIDIDSIMLDPESGQLSYRLQLGLDPARTLHTSGQDDSQWAAISGPILQAARAIGLGASFAPPAIALDRPVPWSVVGRFYREPQDLTPAAKRMRATEIEQDQGFKPLDSSTYAGLLKLRSEDALQDQKAVLGDTYNRHVAAHTLRLLATSAENDTDYGGLIRDGLERKITLHSDATYQPPKRGKWIEVSLLQFLRDHGWDIPTTHEQLINLANALSNAQPKAATHGNLGGALSWPEPLDQASLEQLKGDIRPYGNVLDYLLDGRRLSAEEQANPRALLDDLINSPKGKALGEALQAKFEARSVKGSATDWLLAALNLETTAHSGKGGTLEGYRLVSAENSGKPASMIVQQFADHLVLTGRASSPQTAAVQARVMLAGRAPEFLVKGIPEQVLPGNHSWVSFATAVARIEAQSPGATATMNYVQIMLQASIAPITDTERRTEFAAQNEAIKDWAEASGMGYPSDVTAMTAVRKAFNAQIGEFRAAAETHIGKLPTTESLALEQLKKAFPEMKPELFEVKTITSQPSNRHFNGPYSILDLYIDGRGVRRAPDSADDWGVTGRDFVNKVTFGQVTIPVDGVPAQWVSSSSAIDINHVMAKLNTLPSAKATFETAFADYNNAVKKTTSAQIKHLISSLPLEDRQNLEFGKITIRKEVDYHRTDYPLRTSEGVLLVQTERNGKVLTYEIDRLKGTVTPRPQETYQEYLPTGSFFPKKGKKYLEVKPAGDHSTAERQGAQGVPNSFGSARTQYLVDAVIEDMDWPGVHRSAKGKTTFETEVSPHEILIDIALNLIPLRSAIHNFIKGNVGEGFVDLGFDIFGFAVGLGAAAKGAKALSAGASALSKATQAGKIVGRAAIGALNPLDGIYDLGRGVLKLGHKAIDSSYKGVMQLRGSYRSVNLLELAKQPGIAEGTYKAANGASQSKTLAKFDEASQSWHAFDPRTQQAFGKPLQDFSVVTPRTGDLNGLPSIASADVLNTASQRHGLAAAGKFKVGQKTLEGNVVMFQGNWHQYDPVAKRAFGPPLNDFTPSRVAANGLTRPVDAGLSGYDVRYIVPDELTRTGLQNNVYVGRSHKEYVKVDGTLYESQIKDGQRVIRHPTGNGADIPIRDLGASGWEPSSRSTRLLGGVGEIPTRWKLNERTYVVPMDDIKVVNDPLFPFRINHNNVEHTVTFSSSAGAWKDITKSRGDDVPNPMYFWKNNKGKWQRGPFDEFIKAKKTDAHTYRFVDVSPPAPLKLPTDLKPLPKELHYFWAGQDVPGHLVENISNNAKKAPGYASIIHVDADSPAVFQQIKSKLEHHSPGITVLNLQEDEVFKQLKQGEMYDYFRQGQGKNLAAASDVARYPIMNKYGGVYLDTDDSIQASVGGVALQAGADDVLLGRPVNHPLTDYKSFYNTSNFATRPGNPILEELIAEMKKRFADNKPFFSANRPIATKGVDGRVVYTPEFKAYEAKIFDTVGPNLLNDTLKAKKPDIYDLGLDGTVKQAKLVNGVQVPVGPAVNIAQDVRQYYAKKGIVAPELLDKQLQTVREHNFPLRYKFNVKIGADHSWIQT